jgi:hypothetical protein
MIAADERIEETKQVHHELPNEHFCVVLLY